MEDPTRAIYEENRRQFLAYRSCMSSVGSRRYWPGDDSAEPKTIKETVFYAERYDGDWPPENARGFIAWFENMLYSIPEEFRDSAKIELDSEGSYENSHYASIEITYTRPETQEEIDARRAGYLAQAEREAEAERLELERLKAKYEKEHGTNA